MAIDFPASPTNGQTFTSGSVTYTWDGTKWTAVAAAGSSNSISQGNTNATVTDTGSDGRFVVTTEGSERLRVDSSGRLGVGTASPGGVLEAGAVSGSVTSGDLLVTTGSTTARVTVGRLSGTSNDNTSFRVRNRVDSTLFQVDSTAVTFGPTGTEAARIDSSGRLLVGTSSTRTIGYWDTPQFLLEGTDYQKSSLCIYNNQNEIYGAVLSLGHSRGTSVGSNTILQNNDFIGAIAFHGSDGGNEVHAGQIAAYVDGTPGVNDMPCRLVFSTTADGASSPTTRMTLFSNGNIRAVETASAYFYPGIDNSIYLGSPSFRYNLVYSVNGTASSSDEREKTEINDAALGIDFIKSLRPVSYKWKVGHNDVEAGDEGDVVIPRPGLRTHWGFLAQDVKQAADQAGVDFGGWILTDVDDPESPQGLRYQQFIAPLTKALQEAIAKIETLEAEVAALKAA